MMHHLALWLAAAGAGGAAEPAGWTSWAYVYGVGGLVFAIGLALCLKSGQIDPSRRRGRRILALMIAGFVGYALLQGVMQMALPRW